ncbi:MAG: flagellar hook-associated protein FlgK [Lachnospiraceae bacterium]|nr:flagellar hook-associated protein FlgK [Lachnospiraceae bacterium]
MSSSFFGLTIAYSGLNAAQASINTTANNISNVQTEGYSRQETNLSAATCLRAYQKFGTTSTGVNVDSVKQVRDTYYDTKYWANNTNKGYYEKKYYYMQQIENYYSDGTFSTNSSAGFSTIYAKMFNALDTLKTRAMDTAARNEFISDAQELATYFNATAQSLDDLQSSINDEIKTTVDDINSVATKIAVLNKQINIIELEGGYANELRDQRNLLVDHLSEIVPVEVKERQIENSNYSDQYTGATYYTVKINGQLLVDNYEFETLACKSRDERYNQGDIEGLYDIVWSDTGADFDPTATNMGGTLKAMFEVRDGNNAKNLSGTVIATSSNSITIKNPSITDIDEVNIPESGTIFVNNTKYTYSSFECTTDENGNITDYTFSINKALTTEDERKLAGKNLEVGTSVNYMGIAYYQNQMNTFLRSFTEAFNSIETQGVDLNGNDAGSFFTGKYAFAGTEYTLDDDIKNTVDPNTGDVTPGGAFNSDGNTYYKLTAKNVKVSDNLLKHPENFSTTLDITNGKDAYDIVEKLLELQSKTVVFRGGGGDTFLQNIYADVTVDTQECKIFSDNYTNIGVTIDNQRLSVSGVDEDDEALDLIKFQNSYNLASKCISVLAEMYDQLILNTGV